MPDDSDDLDAHRHVVAGEAPARSSWSIGSFRAAKLCPTAYLREERRVEAEEPRRTGPTCGAGSCGACLDWRDEGGSTAPRVVIRL